MSKPTRCDYFRGITDLNALTKACELFARDIHDRLLVGRLEGDNLSDSLLKADGGLAWSRLPNEPKRLQAPLLSTKKAPAVREKDGAGIEIVVNADDSTSGRVCVVDKDNLGTQIISFIPDDPEDGTSGGAVDFPAGIGVLRTSGNFNLRLSRNSILMLELTSTHIEAADDILPSADSTLDVGSDTTRWRYVYGDRAYVGDGAAGNQIFLDVRNASGRVQLQVNATTDRTITFQDLGYTVENTGHAAKHQNGGADEVATATPGANAIPKADADTFLNQNWLGSGTVGTDDLLRGNQTWVGLSAMLDTITGGTIEGAIPARVGLGWGMIGPGADNALLQMDGINSQVWVSVANALADVLTTRGDILRRGTVGPERLALGTSGQVLKSNGTDAAWAAEAAAGKVKQIVATTGYTGFATTTTTCPLDNTIPQFSEGGNFMALAITPTSASTRLLIIAMATVSHSAAGTPVMHLHRDSGADALAAAPHADGGADVARPVSLRHDMLSPGTSSTTFQTVIGSDTGGTLTFNGRAGGDLYGNIQKSGMIIIEYEA